MIECCQQEYEMNQHYQLSEKNEYRIHKLEMGQYEDGHLVYFPHTRKNTHACLRSTFVNTALSIWKRQPFLEDIR